MPVYDGRAVAGVIEATGGPPAGTTTAQWVQLAKGESSFDSDAEGPTDSQGNVPTGWFQVKHIMHAGTAGGPSSPEQFKAWLKIPVNNWKVAKAIYARQGWGAWEASHAPSEEAKLAAEHPTLAGLELEGHEGVPFVEDVVGAVDDTVDALKAAVGFLSDAAGWLGDPENWKRILYVVAGTAGVLLAVSIVAKPLVAQTVRDVRPV